MRREFLLANPSFKAEQVGVQTSRIGWLREVRICYDRRFRPDRCEPRERGASDAAPLKIWRGL